MKMMLSFLLDFPKYCPYNYHMKTTPRPHAGRPPKSGNENLSERLELRVTSGEKAAYDEAADAAEMERSDWIRMVLTKAAKKTGRKLDHGNGAG